MPLFCLSSAQLPLQWLQLSSSGWELQDEKMYQESAATDSGQKAKGGWRHPLKRET
jgi:hypothetical protein